MKLKKTGHVQKHSKYGRRYPWDTWFRLKSFTVRRGSEEEGGDYEGKTHSMNIMIRQAARRKGVKVSLRTAEDEQSILVRVLGPAPRNP